jgi:hypothetical protein
MAFLLNYKLLLIIIAAMQFFLQFYSYILHRAYTYLHRACSYLRRLVLYMLIYMTIYELNLHSFGCASRPSFTHCFLLEQWFLSCHMGILAKPALCASTVPCVVTLDPPTKKLVCTVFAAVYDNHRLSFVKRCVLSNVHVALLEGIRYSG